MSRRGHFFLLGRTIWLLRRLVQTLNSHVQSGLACFFFFCGQVARVLNNEYPTVEAHIIDCRYPYEYNGGHIKVKMLYTKPVFSTMNLDGSCSLIFLAMMRNVVTLLSFWEDVACSRGVVLLQFFGRQSITSITKDNDRKGHIRSPCEAGLIL